jgi:hypothetical protein
MPYRLFALAVVLLWVGSVAWLCAVVWAPPGSRMARVDPREAYRVFFEWNDSTKMALLENGRRRGEVTVQGGSGPLAETGEIERFLSLSGQIEAYDEGGAVPRIELFWKGVLSFSEEMEWRAGTLTVRIPSNELSARLSFAAPADEGGTPAVGAEIKLGNRELLSIDPASPAASAGLPLLGALGGVGGFGALGGLEGLLETLGPLDPAALHFTAEARTGRFNLAGREIGAFLLVLKGSDLEQEIRIYLSEAGEPLRIETELGFEAVSEILVPLDAYERPSSPN